MVDFGLTHLALQISDMDASLSFYERYADMKTVFRRTLDEDGIRDMAMISDLTRGFAIVLMETPDGVPFRIQPHSHLGVACRSREEVDRLCEEARREGILEEGPEDRGFPVGYWAFVSDPDGHTVELSHGQIVGLALERFAESLESGEQPSPG